MNRLDIEILTSLTEKIAADKNSMNAAINAFEAGIESDLQDHISDVNNPHQTQTTQLLDLEDLVLIFENNLI